MSYGTIIFRFYDMRTVWKPCFIPNFQRIYDPRWKDRQSFPYPFVMENSRCPGIFAAITEIEEQELEIWDHYEGANHADPENSAEESYLYYRKEVELRLRGEQIENATIYCPTMGSIQRYHLTKYQHLPDGWHQLLNHEPDNHFKKRYSETFHQIQSKLPEIFLGPEKQEEFRHNPI